jgi:hypothetical protein
MRKHEASGSGADDGDLCPHADGYYTGYGVLADWAPPRPQLPLRSRVYGWRAGMFRDA